MRYLYGSAFFYRLGKSVGFEGREIAPPVGGLRFFIWANTMREIGAWTFPGVFGIFKYLVLRARITRYRTVAKTLTIKIIRYAMWQVVWRKHVEHNKRYYR